MTDRPSSIHFRENCRICGQTDLEKILRLPDMPFTDAFVRPLDMGKEFLADIDVFLCSSCLTTQTLHDVDVSNYYEDYQYAVGESPFAARFMSNLASLALSNYFDSARDVTVLEIGSGDGAQLAAFASHGASTLGYEPSSTLCHHAADRGIESIHGLFEPGSASSLPRPFDAPDIILLSYTLDHLPDPLDFLQTAKGLLEARDGILIAEIHDLEKIFDRAEYCLFEHEHSVYLTERSAADLCHRAGLEIIEFDLVPTEDRRANSLLFVAAVRGGARSEQPASPCSNESFSKLEHYQSLQPRIDQSIRNLETFVEKCQAGGRSVAGYGAGGRGVMTMAAMKNGHDFAYLADRSPKGTDLLVPKTHIPLVDLTQLASVPVDEIVVFSFGYMDEIRKEVGKLGYADSQFHSLPDLLAGKVSKP